MSGCGTRRRSAESAPKQAARQACFLEALADRPREVRQCVGRCIVKKSDDRFCRLLCAPRNRQRRRANKRDELTTSDAEHGLPTSKLIVLMRWGVVGPLLCSSEKLAHHAAWGVCRTAEFWLRIPTKSPGHSEMMSPGVPT